MRALWKNESGATAVEYAIVGTMLFVLTFGIIDFGYMLFQWEQAAKATQVGVRVAVVSNPVSSFVATFNGTGTGAAVGTSCSSAGGVLAACSYAPITCGNAACSSGTLDANTFNYIVGQMQSIYGRIQPANVRITYSPSDLGTVGAAPLPAVVSVSLTGLNYTYFALSAFLPQLGASLAIPASTATLTSEGL